MVERKTKLEMYLLCVIEAEVYIVYCVYCVVISMFMDGEIKKQ